MVGREKDWWRGDGNKLLFEVHEKGETLGKGFDTFFHICPEYFIWIYWNSWGNKIVHPSRTHRTFIEGLQRRRPPQKCQADIIWLLLSLYFVQYAPTHTWKLTNTHTQRQRDTDTYIRQNFECMWLLKLRMYL